MRNLQRLAFGAARHRTAARRLLVEKLEDRCLPSVAHPLGVDLWDAGLEAEGFLDRAAAHRASLTEGAAPSPGNIAATPVFGSFLADASGTSAAGAKPHLPALSSAALSSPTAPTASAPAANTSAYGSWSPVGPAPIFDNGQPVGGRVDVAVADPRDPNVVYVGCSDGASSYYGGGGIWKTTNWLSGSPTWTPLIDDQPSLSVFGKSLALAPQNPDIVYAAVQGPGGGILRSADAGATWSFEAGAIFNGAHFSGLVVSPQDANTLYVAVRGGTAGGVFESTDGGVSWKNVTFPTLGKADATDLAIALNPANPGGPPVLYAGIVQAATTANNGVQQSLDGGQSWTLMSGGGQIKTGANVGEQISLAIAPSDANTVYTTIFDPSNATGAGALERYRTVNGGGTWTKLNLPMVGGQPSSEWRYWHQVLGVDPSNPNVVYANADEPDLVGSNDGGLTWKVLNRQDDPVNAFFDDTGALMFVGDRGIRRSTAPFAGTDSFVSMAGNLGNFLVNIVTRNLDDPNILFGISQDQVKLYQTTGGAYNYLTTGNEVGRTLINPLDTQIVYNLSSKETTFLTLSTDGGATWSPIGGQIDQSEFTTNEQFSQSAYNAFEMDPTNPQHLVLGGTRVWETTDGGASWQPISPVLSSSSGTPQSITAIAFAPDGRLYAGTMDGKLFSNEGGSWQERDAGLSIVPSNFAVNIRVDPADPNRVILNDTGAAAFGRVWMTTTGGAGWTSIAGDLPSNLNVASVQVDWRGSTPKLFAGTSRGVYVSKDLGGAWTLFNAGMPLSPVRDLELDPRTGLLTAGTFGRGIWQVLVQGPTQTFFLDGNQQLIAYNDDGTFTATGGYGSAISPGSDQVGRPQVAVLGIDHRLRIYDQGNWIDTGGYGVTVLGGHGQTFLLDGNQELHVFTNGVGWTNTGGYGLSISVGQNNVGQDFVADLDGNHQLSVYNQGTWTSTGAFGQTASAGVGQVFFLDGNNQLWSYALGGSAVSTGGYGTAISVGNGALGSNVVALLDGNHQLWTYNQGTWTNTGGFATDLRAGNGDIFIRDGANALWVYTLGSGWSNTGGYAAFLSLGVDALGLDEASTLDGLNRLWKFDQGTWTNTGGFGTYVVG